MALPAVSFFSIARGGLPTSASSYFLDALLLLRDDRPRGVLAAAEPRERLALLGHLRLELLLERLGLARVLLLELGLGAAYERDERDRLRLLRLVALRVLRVLRGFSPSVTAPSKSSLAILKDASSSRVDTSSAFAVSRALQSAIALSTRPVAASSL